MTRRRWIQAAALLMVGLLILIGLFRAVHPAEVADAARHASVGLVLLGMLAFFGFILVRGLRWKVILDASAPRAGLADTAAVTAVGFAVNSVAAFKVGELIRIAAIAPRARIGIGEAGATVVLERVLDVLALLVLAVAAAAASGSGAGGAGLWGGILVFSAVSIAIGLAAFGLVSNPQRTLRWCSQLSGRLPAGVRGKALGFAESVLRGFTTLRSAARLSITLVLSLATWIFILLALAALFRSVSGQLRPATLLLALALFTITQAVSITPGSVGTFEGFYLVVLSAFGAGPQALVTAAAVITHIANIAALLIAGGLGALWLRVVPSTPVRLQRPLARQDSA